jgi:hypothetical protein
MNQIESSLDLGPLPVANLEPGARNVVSIPLSTTVEADLSAQPVHNPDFQPLAGSEGGSDGGRPGCFGSLFSAGRVLCAHLLKRSFNK